AQAEREVWLDAAEGDVEAELGADAVELAAPEDADARAQEDRGEEKARARGRPDHPSARRGVDEAGDEPLVPPVERLHPELLEAAVDVRPHPLETTARVLLLGLVEDLRGADLLRRGRREARELDGDLAGQAERRQRGRGPGLGRLPLRLGAGGA